MKNYLQQPGFEIFINEYIEPKEFEAIGRFWDSGSLAEDR